MAEREGKADDDSSASGAPTELEDLLVVLGGNHDSGIELMEMSREEDEDGEEEIGKNGRINEYAWQRE